jgi:hypothetical protein
LAFLGHILGIVNGQKGNQWGNGIRYIIGTMGKTSETGCEDLKKILFYFTY